MMIIIMVMIVTAMLVMDMLGMTMRVMVMLMLAVIVRIMVMMVMPMMVVAVIMMPMTGRLVRSGIGAAFGIERRLDLDHPRAKTLHHLLDDMIAADTQPLGHDLRRQMAIAEMPGEPHQMAGIGTTDLDQRLRRCDHLDQAAVFQHQRIAAAQGDGVFEIEQEFQSARPRNRHAATMTIVEVENDGVYRRLFPVVLAFDLSRADHGISRSAFLFEHDLSTNDLVCQ
ncbi:putative Rdx family selenoprotein [Tardiphaga robiniae]|nr:putative Rdx family selenoprotein [Tardiphaga robiniae]